VENVSKETDTVSRTKLVIITGLSGAGKSTAMRFLDDLGYNCLDNLPPELISTVFNLYEQTHTGGPGVAIASDVRSGALFGDFSEAISALNEAGVDFVLLYLDCSTGTLIRRFKEVRRTHPLQITISMEEAIEEERRRLEPIRTIATRILDTSRLNSNGLHEKLINNLAGVSKKKIVSLEFTSFGFKYGLPQDVDFVFDVRFLPNPFYEPDLRSLTGDDQAVYDYVMKSDLADNFFNHVVELIEMTLPSFLEVGKTTLSIGIGCTGGRHRSVAFTKRMANHFAGEGRVSRAIHRDTSKPRG
jgi:RNase adapter protein RapZ